MPRRPATRKAGGREPAAESNITLSERERIEQQADPLGWTIKVARGNAIQMRVKGGKTWVYPTVEQVERANRTLLNKLVPDIRAVALSGALDLSGKIEVVTGIDHAPGSKAGT